MPMYNLLEYSENYSMIAESLWNYLRDRIDNINDNASDGKPFKYKTKIVGKTPARPGNEGDANRPAVLTLSAEAIIPLKYLSTFWRFLYLTLINRQIELDLSWTKDCLLIEYHKNITKVNFMITSTKLPVVTLSINGNIKFLENIKLGFKRTSYWNKYRSEITTQAKNNNLDCLIDTTFTKTNRLFVLSFRNGNDDPTRNSFNEYYVPLVEIKDFNALIDNKPFFDQLIKTSRKRMKNLLKYQEVMIIQQETY